MLILAVVTRKQKKILESQLIFLSLPVSRSSKKDAPSMNDAPKMLIFFVISEYLYLSFFDDFIFAAQGI